MPQVAQLLLAHSTGSGARNSGTKSSVLIGKLFDESDEGLTPSHAVKGACCARQTARSPRTGQRCKRVASALLEREILMPAEIYRLIVAAR